jgi:hypothetical protein
LREQSGHTVALIRTRELDPDWLDDLRHHVLHAARERTGCREAEEQRQRTEHSREGNPHHPLRDALRHPLRHPSRLSHASPVGDHLHHRGHDDGLVEVIGRPTRAQSLERRGNAR